MAGTVCECSPISPFPMTINQPGSTPGPRTACPSFFSCKLLRWPTCSTTTCSWQDVKLWDSSISKHTGPARSSFSSKHRAIATRNTPRWQMIPSFSGSVLPVFFWPFHSYAGSKIMSPRAIAVSMIASCIIWFHTSSSMDTMMYLYPMEKPASTLTRYYPGTGQGWGGRPCGVITDFFEEGTVRYDQHERNELARRGYHGQ